MPEQLNNISFQADWHILQPGLRLIEYNDDCSAFITYDSNSELRLFNAGGQELWRRKTEYKLLSVSLSNNLKVLAVDENKFAVLYENEGAPIWRKRPFPAQYGQISANGEEFAFITADPAIVGANSFMQLRWSYRNLMKRPKKLAISAKGELTAFPTTDTRGDGFAGVNHLGKPIDSLMGVGNIVSIALNKNGSIALILSESGEAFCMNIAKSSGVWRGQFSKELCGVSFASQSEEALLYGTNGKMIKLDKNGKTVWEHELNEKLISAKISSDGRTIIYAVAHGAIAALVQTAEVGGNKLVFKEKAPKPLPESVKCSFQKIWQIDLLGSSERKSKIFIWRGEDGVEYSLVWNGKENLFCINDLGEEIWNSRINGANVIDLAVSEESDTVIALTGAGLLGFDLSGAELFRMPGEFKRVCLFYNAAMILADKNGLCRYYAEAEHFSHNIAIKEPPKSFIAVGKKLVLHTAKSLLLLNSDGETEKQIDLENDSFTCAVLSSKGTCLLCGTEGGKALVYDLELQLVFSYTLPCPISLLEYNQELEVLFIAGAEGSLYILNRRKQDIIKNSLTGKPIFMVSHEEGAIVATDLDQLGLVNSGGQILARYTSPYKITKMLWSHRRMSAIILTDEALTCIAALTSV